MGECKRILQVVSIMNRGGVETMLMNLYRNIDREKIQFDFVVHHREKAAFDDEIKALGGKIYYAPRYKVINHKSYKTWWKHFFEEHKEYKIVHSHTYAVASIQLEIAKKYGLTTIVHSHNTRKGEGIKGKVKGLLERRISEIPNYLFACSDKAGEWLYGESYKSNGNYHLLKNAIDTKSFIFDPQKRIVERKKLGVEDKFVIGHIGRFFVQKNHKYLIDIFFEIQKINKDAILLLIGDGELRPEIQKKVTELHLEDKVIMTGVRSDVNCLLQAMDCFVFPSLYEGLPVTVIEAQAAGLPCIISDTITDEVCVTDRVQLLSIEEKPSVWAEIIAMHSRDERKDMSDEIRKAGYDIATTTEWLTDFYLNL